MCGMNERHIRNAAVTLVSITRRHSSSVNSVTGLRTLMPALLIRIFTLPNAATQLAASTRADLIFAGDVGWKAAASPPSAAISPATASSSAASRETRATRAPSAASASAMALPSPLLAPVITAMRPASFPLMPARPRAGQRFRSSSASACGSSTFSIVRRLASPAVSIEILPTLNMRCVID